MCRQTVSFGHLLAAAIGVLVSLQIHAYQLNHSSGGVTNKADAKIIGVGVLKEIL
jgi:hypothetical protein